MNILEVHQLWIHGCKALATSSTKGEMRREIQQSTNVRGKAVPIHYSTSTPRPPRLVPTRLELGGGLGILRDVLVHRHVAAKIG